MLPHPFPELPSLPQQFSSGIEDRVSLVISLTAAPSSRLTHEISTVLNRSIDPPCTFLGGVGETLTLGLNLNDIGLIATETLARRLIKIKGVNKIVAERICARRGAIYAISLKSISGLT